MRSILHLAPVGLLALLTTTAHAFVPPAVDAPGLADQRVLTFHPTTQAQIQSRSIWQRFLQGEGDGWRARFDELTGVPHRMWGPPIDMGPARSEDQVLRSLLAFVDRNSELLGTYSKDLEPLQTTYDEPTDTWYVELQDTRGALPILGARITARIRFGRLVMLGATTLPGATLRQGEQLDRIGLDASTATRRAIAQGPVPNAVHTEISTSRILVPVYGDGAPTLVPAWKVSAETAHPPGKWDYYIGGKRGEFLGVTNNIRFLNGTVTGLHDVRTVNGEQIESPLPFIEIFDGEASENAAEDGSYDVEGDEFSARLRSPYFRVLNATDESGSLPLEGDGLFDEEHATMAEIDTYVFLHQIREWGLRVSPDHVGGRIDANVNLDETCNAYYDGDVNFFQAGRGCNNTGRIADVVYHEWGHGLHFRSLMAGTFDGSLSEGAADTVAFLQTGEPVIAPYFNTNGGGIRDVSSGRTYPDDYIANDVYVHSNGLIFGGSMWDLWGRMIDRYGDEEGTLVMEDIFTRLLQGGPDIASSYDEAVFADDDDGDLSNGTPNQCEIVDAFGSHGLGPKGWTGPWIAYHEPPPISADHPTDLTATLIPRAEQCFDAVPSGATLYLKVNAGDWQELPADLGEDSVTATLPLLSIGDLIEYYFSVEDTSGAEIFTPRDGPIRPFTGYAGDVLPVWCQDFEEDDGGFAHELIEGEEREGADDWTWGRPHGVGGDPAEAASGRNVWGNDLGGGDYNGQYQDEKENRLTSPPIDTLHYTDVFLNYQRWLTVEDGVYDQASILANDEPVWTNWSSSEEEGTEHHLDDQWVAHAVELEGIGDQTTLQIAFDLKSDRGATFGGWTLDDFCLLAPATADNRLGVADLVATGNGEAIELAWTNPRHAPLQQVRLVRTRNHLPTGPDDGKILWEDDAPELASSMSFLDDQVSRKGTYYYAVYGNDGEAWLSWTILDLNAAAGAANGEPELPREGAGCGCRTPAYSSTAGWWLVGVLGLLARRRRPEGTLGA